MASPLNPNGDPLRLDQACVRRGFERAASGFDAAAALHREVATRMAERLGAVRIAPAVVLDAGCGTGEALGELCARYPDARAVGVDLAYNMASATRARAAADRRSGTHPQGSGARVSGTALPLWVICGDMQHLPLRAGAVDLVWSNLALQWANEPALAFAEFHRVLATGGLLSFTTLGPDTLRELRSAFAAADSAVHVHRFVDMHDLGDMLMHAGFADPVMDMETLTLVYTDAQALILELRALGATNAAKGRRRTLTGARRWRRALAALEGFRAKGGLPASFEIVYGHAWKPEPKQAADGRAIVRFPRALR